MGHVIAWDRGSEGSQSRQAVVYGGTRNQESLYCRDHQQLAKGNHGDEPLIWKKSRKNRSWNKSLVRRKTKKEVEPESEEREKGGKEQKT
jgi:hypothetical protein